MPRHTDRRTVLRTAGGLLAGPMVLAGSGAAEKESLQLDVLQETVNPDHNGLLPVEVSDYPKATFNPDQVYMGPDQRFESGEEGSGTIFVGGDSAFGVPNPVRGRFVGESPGDRLIMHFDNQAVGYPAAYEDVINMVLAVFPEGSDPTGTPTSDWDTDTVRISPRGTDN